MSKMDRCGIKQCSSTSERMDLGIYFHRLPQEESRKEEWLKIIGDHLRPRLKVVYVCSLHFEKSSFEKILDALRLRFDAVPAQHLVPQGRQPKIKTHGKNRSHEDTDNKETSKIVIDEDDQVNGDLCTDDDCDEEIDRKLDLVRKLPRKGTKDDVGPEPKRYLFRRQAQTIKNLREKCTNQSKQIRTLNDIIKRQTKKLTLFSTVIIELREKSNLNNI